MRNTAKASIAIGAAAAWLGGGSGVATILAEYPPEDAACGGSTSTVPEKIV